MPLRHLRPFAAAMPRIEARENLLTVARLTVPRMKNQDRARTLARWRREADLNPAPTRIRDAAALSRLAVGSGIGFRVVKRGD